MLSRNCLRDAVFGVEYDCSFVALYLGKIPDRLMAQEE